MVESPTTPPTSPVKGPRPRRPVDTSNQIIERQLSEASDLVARKAGGDCLTFVGPIVYGVEDYFRDALEAKDPKQDRLFVILETTGGYIEVAQRIADTLRHHYSQLEFIVPNFSMSAGTVLVMSGDAIHMDYYSILGPIDPQVERNGHMVPALGYLIQYERLIEKSRRNTLTTAELAYLVQNFDGAELYRYEQARKLSVALLKEWLVKYKFKNWNRTATRNKKVLPSMRMKRAEQIANTLSDTERWNSHGRGISKDVLINDVQLQIEDFGADLELDDAIRRYYKLLKDYMMRMGQSAVIHNGFKFTPLF
jgi:hypothetical protein